MSNNELVKVADEFFSRELMSFEVFDEFSELNGAVQKFITTDKALTLKLISYADGGCDRETIPAAIFEVWRDDKEVWLELVRRNYDALELLPVDMIDDNFAIESLRCMFREEEKSSGEGDALFDNDMREWLEAWYLRFRDSNVASSTSFFKAYLALERSCLRQPDEPFLFWVFSIARPIVFKDDTLCSDFLDAFRERVSKLTDGLFTFFGNVSSGLNYTWNSVAHPAVLDRCVRASDYKNNPDIATKLFALRQEIARNFEVLEDFVTLHYDLHHLTDERSSQINEVSSAQDWDKVLYVLITDIDGPQDIDSQALEKNSFGREDLEAKVSRARKSCISKYRSVNFGALSDSDLELVGKYSEDANVLAMVFRSKSNAVREALATNGRECAYDTSLALLSDKTVTVKEAVLSHAWMHDDDFKVLCETNGFRTNKTNHLRVFTSNIYSWTDLQLTHLVKNVNVSEDLLRSINLDAIANAALRISWNFERLTAPERADAKAKELKRIESEYINQQGREMFHLNSPHPELSASERARLRDVEEELRHLNMPN